MLGFRQHRLTFLIKVSFHIVTLDVRGIVGIDEVVENEPEIHT